MSCYRLFQTARWNQGKRDYCVDLLRFFFPDADNIFDFSQQIGFLESELADIDPEPDTHKDSVVADRVLKVQLLSGAIAWVVINIEIQGYEEEGFAERVFRYFYRLMDKYGKRVAILTIYTDSVIDFEEDSFNYSLMDTRLSFSFKAYKVFKQKEAELLRDTNPVALIMLAFLLVTKNANKKDKTNLLEQGIRLAETICERDIDDNLKSKLLKTIQLYFNFKMPEIRSKLDGVIDSLTNKLEPMGIFELAQLIAVEEAEERGIDIGRHEKDTVFVTNLITSTNFSIEKIASLALVSVEFALEVRKKLTSF